MKNKKLLLLFVLAVSLGVSLQTFAVTTTQKPQAKTPVKVEQKVTPKNYQQVDVLDVVDKADKYLNKDIKVNATFDKFSTLGLDYKPALRDSQNYIGFLIKKPDSFEKKVPLSEMKIFMQRKMAEKYIELETGDEIEFEGTVFSSALGDPWVEVDSLKITKKVVKPANKK